MEKLVLVTGAAGFIGYHLSESLLKKGWKVLGFDNINEYYDVNLKLERLERLKQQPNFTFIKGSLEDEDVVNMILRTYRPSIVVNLAAQAGVRYSLENPYAYISSNIDGFFNILEACRKYPVEHFIFASSSSVYGNQNKVPFSVKDNVDKPVSLYAATKKCNELLGYSYSHLFHIPMTGLRFFTVYGPFGRPDMAYFSFTERILKGEPIKVYNYGDLYRDFTYIDDIVTSVDEILVHPPVQNEQGVQFKVYNIGNGRPEKLLTFIEILEKHLGIKAIKDLLPMQAGDVYQTFADVSELEKDFGFRPQISLNEGLGKFVEWYFQYMAHTRLNEKQKYI